MCGIFGGFSFAGEFEGAERVRSLANTLSHRGPDAVGVRVSPWAALGATRLRITDPHPRADQPFVSPDNRYWLAGNGEIYNHGQLKEASPSYPFGSRSDIETAVPLLIDSIERIVEIEGKFAIVMWDNEARQVTFARDRAGECPLFYAHTDRMLLVASEIQTLLAGGASRELDDEALAQYLRLGYCLEPRTPFKHIKRVPAGSALTFDSSGTTTHRYWHPEKISTRTTSADDVAVAIAAAVEAQSGADPLGLFLSGGLDSSLILALASRSRTVHTYSAAFADTDFDESPAARAAAHAFGSIHTEVTMTDESLERDFETMVGRIAEPILDPATLPTLALAEAAKADCRMVLAGEGADEIFGGYPTYRGHVLAGAFAQLPAWLRGNVTSTVRRLAPNLGRVPLEFLLKKFVGYANWDWARRHGAWFGVGAVSIAPTDPLEQIWEGLDAEILARGSAAAPLLDYLTYLRDNLLVKVDRATMLHSIEARAPFLDSTVTSLGLALPIQDKVGILSSKHLLRAAAARYLPERMLRRTKRGLSVPTGRLINGRLAARVDELLRKPRLAQRRLIEETKIARLLYEHRNGIANHARPLWAVTVMEAWLERWSGD